MIGRIWRRVSDRDRLAYMMVVCFGLCLLVAVTANELRYCLYEGRLPVRVIEYLLAIGLMALGVERLRSLRRRRKDGY